MANGILIHLNRSLEITLRDNLDGLKEFTLMMASTSLRPQFEILPAEHKLDASAHAPSPASVLRLVDTQPTETSTGRPLQKKKFA